MEGPWHLHDLIVVLQDLGDLLEVQTLKRLAISAPKLNGIVLETPLAALQGNGLVDLGNQLRDSPIGACGHVPHELDLRDAMAADEQ